MILRLTAPLLLLLLAAGCGDPVPNADAPLPPPPEVPPPAPADGEPNTPNDGGPADGAPMDGVAPGGEGAPPPGAPEGQDSRFLVGEGEGVEVSGSISYGGTAEGKIFLDVLDAATEGDQEAMRLLHSTTLDAIGNFSITAPADFGPVRLCVFIDVDDNGPTPADPKAISLEPVVIGSSAVTGLSLELLDDWDVQHAESTSAYQSGAEIGAGTMPAGDAAPPPAPIDGEPVAPTEPSQGDPPPDANQGAPAAPEGQGVDPGMGGQGQLDGERSGHDMSCPYHGLGLAYLTQTSD